MEVLSVKAAISFGELFLQKDKCFFYQHKFMVIKEACTNWLLKSICTD